MNSFFRALLEAKGEKTPEPTPDSNTGATDYSASEDVGADNAPDTPEPDNTGADSNESTPDDTQSGNDSGDTAQDDGSGEDAGDGATDYSADGEDDMGGDIGGSDTTGGDSTPQDDSGSTDEPPEDENFSPEDAQKNQVLYQDFCYFFEQINRIEKSLSRGSRRDMLTTQVYSTVTDNIRRLKDDMFHYMTEVFVGRTYAQNLYQFNSYIEALRLNIQMLKKIGSLNANS